MAAMEDESLKKREDTVLEGDERKDLWELGANF